MCVKMAEADYLIDLNDLFRDNMQSSASPAPSYTRPGDVECDTCLGRKRKAVNSCLVCLASYCEDHLKPHHQSPNFKKHNLIEASADLQGKICTQHIKLMEVYCRTDQKLICHSCLMEEHKDHDTVSAKDGSTEKKIELKKEYQKSLQKKIESVKTLKQTMETIKMRSQESVADSERIFSELISSMKKKRSQVTELIRDQEKAELSRAERLLKQLEQEIADLEKTVNDLEQLSHTNTHDHVHFLQKFPFLSVSPECEDSPRFTVNQHHSVDGVRIFLPDLKRQVEEICEENFNKLHPHAAGVLMSLPPRPKNREDFLKYFCHLTLDPNTAHNKLILSEQKRTVSHNKAELQYSDHPERFDKFIQVLCKEKVYGRCYWEVEWNGMGVEISVSYKGISRKGEDDACVFGLNRKSWSLQCYPTSLCFWHEKIKTELQGPASNKIGVYVDHFEGTLSFYSISDEMKLLHRVHTTFTRPLYAGFKMCFYHTTMRLCDPN